MFRSKPLVFISEVGHMAVCYHTCDKRQGTEDRAWSQVYESEKRRSPTPPPLPFYSGLGHIRVIISEINFFNFYYN